MTNRYDKQKAVLINLIKIKEQQLNKFLDYQYAKLFTIDDLQSTWDWNEKFLAKCQGELLLLEAKKLLQIEL